MAIANGYFVIITTSHESYEHEKRNIENLVNMRVEGIIACLSQETTDFSHISALKDINMPLILFDRVCLTDQFSSVIADGAQSAQMATQHLLDNGSKRVAFIGGANHLDIVKRRKHGYLEALRENRIPIEKELVVCRKIDYEEGKIATETLLSLPQPPDAILAMNDTLAFAAMEGYLEKLQQVRYSDHTVRVYTSYFRDFQQYFEGRKIETRSEERRVGKECRSRWSPYH